MMPMPKCELVALLVGRRGLDAVVVDAQLKPSGPPSMLSPGMARLQWRSMLGQRLLHDVEDLTSTSSDRLSGAPVFVYASTMVFASRKRRHQRLQRMGEAARVDARAEVTTISRRLPCASPTAWRIVGQVGERASLSPSATAVLQQRQAHLHGQGSGRSSRISAAMAPALPASPEARTLCASRRALSSAGPSSSPTERSSAITCGERLASSAKNRL